MEGEGEGGSPLISIGWEVLRSIYDVLTGEGVGQEIPPICGQTGYVFVDKEEAGEGSKHLKIFWTSYMKAP